MTILKKSANIKSTNKTDETNTHLKRGKITGENEEIIVMTRKLFLDFNTKFVADSFEKYGAGLSRKRENENHLRKEGTDRQDSKS